VRRDLGLEVDEATSQRLARIRQHGTDAELTVRRIASGLGLRYRVKNRDLPGSPDLANRSRRWAVFVHGCYWHSHDGCPRATVPKRNRAFWEKKFSDNRARDRRAAEELESRGFRVLTIWQCELDHPELVRERLAQERDQRAANRPS
jgi:DNA mismatch endonuclease (patch repair protein)